MKNFKRWIGAFVAAWITLIAATPAAGAPMSFSMYRPCDGNGSMCAPQIIATGDIEGDSSRRLLAFLRSPQFQETGVQKATIAFNSAGGSVVGAMEMGRLIRKLRFDTFLAPRYVESVYPNDKVVATNVVCASACSLAFIGGVQRAVEPKSRFGVHQFYAKKDVGDSATQTIVVALAAYIEEMGVDRGMLDRASLTPPGQMLWLPQETILELGIDTTRPPLAAWQLDAAKDGSPYLTVAQRVTPQRQLTLRLAKLANEPGNYILVAVVNVDASQVDRFPEGADMEASIDVDRVPLRIKPVGTWMKYAGDKSGRTFFGTMVVPKAEVQRLGRAKVVQFHDGFPMAISDVFVSTEISTEKLAPGAALLLRTQ